MICNHTGLPPSAICIYGSGLVMYLLYDKWCFFYVTNVYFLQNKYLCQYERKVSYHRVWLECINGGKQIKRASPMYILQNGYLCDSHWPWATPHQRYCPNQHNMQLALPPRYCQYHVDVSIFCQYHFDDAITSNFGFHYHWMCRTRVITAWGRYLSKCMSVGKIWLEVFAVWE